MKQNQHETINEFFKRFAVIQRELIDFRDSLAEEGLAAFNANEVRQGAVYSAMFDRVQILLESMQQCHQTLARDVGDSKDTPQSEMRLARRVQGRGISTP